MRIRRPKGQRKPTCSKCNGKIEETRTSGQGYCRSCHAAYMRATRPKHSELDDEQRRKANARSYLKEYVKRGAVRKLPCSVCNDVNSEAHHKDYSKPLEVIWFCRKHHLEYHRENGYSEFTITKKENRKPIFNTNTAKEFIQNL